MQISFLHLLVCSTRMVLQRIVMTWSEISLHAIATAEEIGMDGVLPHTTIAMEVE